MKSIMIVLLLIITSFSNIYAFQHHASMMNDSVKEMSMDHSMDSDCHMNMDSTKMESMNNDDSLMTENCIECTTHCMSGSISILHTPPLLSLKQNDNSFNSYLKSFKITKQISSLFRPPIA